MKKSILLSATVLVMTLTLTTSCKKKKECIEIVKKPLEYQKEKGPFMTPEQKDTLQMLENERLNCLNNL